MLHKKSTLKMKLMAALFKLPLGCILFGLLCWSPLPLFAGGGGHAAAGGERAFPIPESSYAELEAQQLTRQGQAPGLIEQLKIRAAADPFNLVATTIFFLAVVHTFLAAKFNRLAHRYEQLHRSNMRAQQKRFVDGREPVSFRATLFHFLGEVEAIFGIWLVPARSGTHNSTYGSFTGGVFVPECQL